MARRGGNEKERALGVLGGALKILLAF